MPNLQKLLDQTDRLQATHQEVSDAAQAGDIGAMINLEDNYNHQCVNLAPQLAKALQAVIADCDETIEDANKYGMADMHLMGQGAQARATRKIIAKTLGADHE